MSDKKSRGTKPMAFPFTSEVFLNRWQVWKDYKREQFKFRYKPIGEQTALTLLGRLSGGSEEKALKIIEQSIANGWKGFFNVEESKKDTAFPVETNYNKDSFIL